MADAASKKPLSIPKPRGKPPPELDTDDRSRELRQTPLDYKLVFAGKLPTQGTDPCELASRASKRCLEWNPMDRRACELFFEDYKICKKKWTSQRWSDFLHGKG